MPVWLKLIVTFVFSKLKLPMVEEEHKNVVVFVVLPTVIEKCLLPQFIVTKANQIS